MLQPPVGLDLQAVRDGAALHNSALLIGYNPFHRCRAYVDADGEHSLFSARGL
jgi:hypothetical protein